jgi:hypothetical protein
MEAHTRTHVYLTFANPFLACDACGERVRSGHDGGKCGCEWGSCNWPCGHNAGATSVCPSWSPVDGCRCAAHLGSVQHGLPPTT